MKTVSKKVIAEKIVLEAHKSLPIAGPRLKYIDDIINDPTNPEFSTPKFTKTADVSVLIALIDTPNIPSNVKEEAFKTILTQAPSASSHLLSSLLFYGNKENLQKLSSDLSHAIVNKIKWDDFSNELFSYLKSHPDTIKLPFANTDIEKFLFDKLLKNTQTIETSSNPVEIPSPITYRFIEFISNAGLLNDAIHQRFALPPIMISSLINNKNISPGSREKLFEADADISKIKFCDSNKAKELYETVIFPLSNSSDFVLTGNSNTLTTATSCLTNLINNQLLPEACELDFIKRYLNNEIWQSSHFIATLLNNTKYQSVLNQVTKIPQSYLVTLVLDNPNVSFDIQKQVVDQFLDNITNKKARGVWSDWNKHDSVDFAIHCARKACPTSTYARLLDCATTAFVRAKILESMALNAFLPQTILDSIVVNSFVSPSIQTYYTFNQEGRKTLLAADEQKFLNSVELIYRYLQHDISIPEGYELFTPVRDANLLNRINKVLDNIIKNQTDAITLKCARYYRNAIIKKQIEIEAEQIIQTENVDIASLKALREAKIKLQDQILKPCESNLELSSNGFKFYLLYKNLIKYMDLYQKINEKIKAIDKNQFTLFER